MLPYSKEVWFAVFAQYNSDVWPAIFVFYLWFALALWWSLVKPHSRGGRWLLPLALAMAWVWTGVGFYALVFAHYDFLAPVESFLWLLQALIMLAAVLRSDGWAANRVRGLPHWVGMAAIGFGLLGSPLFDLASGIETDQLRWFGVAPGPTLMVSLGVFLLAWGRWYLWVLPLLWSIKAGLVAWWLGVFQDLLLPVFSVLLAATGWWSSLPSRRQ